MMPPKSVLAAAVSVGGIDTARPWFSSSAIFLSCIADLSSNAAMYSIAAVLARGFCRGCDRGSICTWRRRSCPIFGLFPSLCAKFTCRTVFGRLRRSSPINDYRFFRNPRENRFCRVRLDPSAQRRRRFYRRLKSSP